MKYYLLAGVILLIMELYFKPRLDISRRACLIWYTAFKYKYIRHYVKIW